MRMDPECNKNWDALLLRLLGAQPIDWSSQLGCAETCNSNHAWFQMRKYGDQEFVSPKEHSIICCKFFSNFCLLSNQILDKAAGTTNTTVLLLLLPLWAFVKPACFSSDHSRLGRLPTPGFPKYHRRWLLVRDISRPDSLPVAQQMVSEHWRVSEVNQSIKQPV